MKTLFTLSAALCMIGIANWSAALEVKINTNMVIESDGTMRMDNAATVWDDVMVYPDANDTFSNEVGMLGFDIHYEKDTQGSRLEFTK